MATKIKALTYAEQFAADKAAKASKPAPQRRKPTVVEDVTPKPVSSIDEDISDIFKKYKVTLPSGTRLVISFVASMCVGGLIGYIGGTLLEFLVLGAMTLSSSLFLSVALYVLGIIGILHAGYCAGSWVGGVIMNQDVDRCYKKYSSLVTGWFSNSKVIPS